MHQTVEALVKQAVSSGATDNVTAVLVGLQFKPQTVESAMVDVRTGPLHRERGVVTTPSFKLEDALDVSDTTETLTDTADEMSLDSSDVPPEFQRQPYYD